MCYGIDYNSDVVNAHTYDDYDDDEDDDDNSDEESKVLCVIFSWL